MQILTLWYLFWLGLGVGLSILVMTAYRAVSPRWLTWSLWGCGLLMIGRYLTMALFATGAAPGLVGLLQRLWFGSIVGLTFPGVVALDQLVRHPAMTPKKLVQKFAPFLAAYALVLLLGGIRMTVDPVTGLRPRLVGWAVWLLALTQLAFLAIMTGVTMQLVKKLPSPHIKRALIGLIAAYLYIGLDGLLLACGVWYCWPFLYSEILTLVALWWAFDTAQRHPL